MISSPLEVVKARPRQCAALACMLLVSLAFVACDREPTNTTLPTGTQTLTGALLPTEISLLRRGTHMLQIDGKDTYYVESNRVSLRRYEGKNLVIEGTLQQNVDPSFLPVLVAERVVAVLEESLKEWKLPSLTLTISVPETWNGSVADGEAIFSIPGSVDPIIRITERPKEDIAGGVPIVIDKARAIRVANETLGGETVYLTRGDKQLVFVFNPLASDRPDAQYEMWLLIMKSITLGQSQQTTSTNTSTGTGSVTGTPCGGTAGILCPKGSYCDITNLQENIGVCRKY